MKNKAADFCIRDKKENGKFGGNPQNITEKRPTT